jgi:hypothetical protein
MGATLRQPYCVAYPRLYFLVFSANRLAPLTSKQRKAYTFHGGLGTPKAHAASLPTIHNPGPGPGHMPYPAALVACSIPLKRHWTTHAQTKPVGQSSSRIYTFSSLPPPGHGLTSTTRRACTRRRAVAGSRTRDPFHSRFPPPPPPSPSAAAAAARGLPGGMEADWVRPRGTVDLLGRQKPYLCP